MSNIVLRRQTGLVKQSIYEPLCSREKPFKTILRHFKTIILMPLKSI